MKVQVEFKEIQEMKDRIETQADKIRELEYKLSKAQPNEVAKTMAAEYIAQFFSALGVEHREGDTQFWTTPPGANWKGTCNVGMTFSKKGDEPIAFATTVKYWE